AGGSRNWSDRVRRFTAEPDGTPGDRYIGWTRFFGDAELAALARPALAAPRAPLLGASPPAAFAPAPSCGPPGGRVRVDLDAYLPDDLLAMADRMSMSHSLEVRAPFCDHRLIEASLGLPSRTKLARGRLKALLKTAFAGVLPDEVFSHPKQGFMIPLW